MLNRNVHTVGVCFGFVPLPMASFRQEGNNALLQLLEIACPPFCSCWGVVVVALPACAVRIPVCAPTSSSKEVALAQAGRGFPSGERSGVWALRFLAIKLRKKCSVQSSLKDLGFSGDGKAVHKMNFYCQNGSYNLEWFRLHLYKAARNCSLESCGEVL